MHKMYTHVNTVCTHMQEVSTVAPTEPASPLACWLRGLHDRGDGLHGDFDNVRDPFQLLGSGFTHPSNPGTPAP